MPVSEYLSSRGLAQLTLNERFGLLTANLYPFGCGLAKAEIRGDGHLRNRTSLELDVNPLLKAIMLCLAPPDT
jgi:hypothetical protein